ncbi:MAG: type I secretion C-terminal target domain-containing protein, partial [Motiliproteus sp.]|nr:type I secretion C-terminal target domain-containing protein [Motiliproteus sp.]MCW9052471.1 type I secretion C-terminal target domain-containing protein [Motiliproteus sp.]
GSALLNNPSVNASVTTTDGAGNSVTADDDATVQINTNPTANDDFGNAGLLGEYFGYEQGVDGFNLSSIGQVETFLGIDRANSLNQSLKQADATFVSTEIDYDWASKQGPNYDLGRADNLQEFLRGDASSLSTDPGDTSDAIIRMQGFVSLSQGDYKFQVTGDDGYSIRIDGVEVARVDKNQAPTTDGHPVFTIDQDGYHSIEIIYWDQAGRYTLKVELGHVDEFGQVGEYNVLGADTTVSSLVTGINQQLVVSSSSLLANDVDPEGDPLSVISTDNAVGGEVSMINDSLVYTPDQDFTGNGSFDYSIADGNGGSSTATVHIYVSPNGTVATSIDLSGNDQIVGGDGNDILTGGSGQDLFIWKDGDSGADSITDFNLTDDALDLSDLLQGENSANLDSYLNVSLNADGDTQIDVTPTGSGGVTQSIVLEGVDLTTEYATTSSPEILTKLVNDSKLIID